VRKTSLVPFTLCLLAAGALAACSSPNADWQKASAQGTVAAYRSFIHHHPDDPRVQQARNRIASLQDKQAWEAARSANAEQSYRQYLAQYPNGAYTAEAQGRLTRLKEASAWQSAKTAGTAAAYEAFVSEFPNATQVPRAQAAIDKLAGYQIELGRYRSASAATAAAKRLKARFASVLTEVSVVPPSGAEKLSTLRSQQMSHAAALAACAELRRARQSCSVVKIQAQAAGLSLSGV
jgi:outer membrane protein assembly factor BamD (BamD/ComL family)